MKTCENNQMNRFRFSAVLVWMLASFLIVHLLPSSVRSQTGALTHIYVDQASGSNGAGVAGTEQDPFKSITYAMLIMKNRPTSGIWVLHIKAGVYDADQNKPPSEREIFPIELRNGMIVQGDDGAENCVISGAKSTDSSAAMFRGQNLSSVTIRDLTFKGMNRVTGYE